MKYFKEGQTVYHYLYGKGVVYRVYEFGDYPVVIEYEDCKITFTTDGRQVIDEPITLSQNQIPEIVNVPLEENCVPFTFEDRELLRGQWVREKISEEESMITYVSNKGVCINGSYYTYEELFRDFEFIDGKTCGREI